VDADTRFSNSEIKSVLFSSAAEVLITPNPASSFVNIYMSKSKNSLSQIIVTDANGKTIERITTAEQTYRLTTSGYAKGLYIIKVASAENNSTQKVVIQ
jgi:Secretion system C-terminal sorting domain